MKNQKRKKKKIYSKPVLKVTVNCKRVNSFKLRAKWMANLGLCQAAVNKSGKSESEQTNL